MARHGARAITSVCGTVDMAEALGVDVECDAEVVAESIEKVGIGLFNGMKTGGFIQRPSAEYFQKPFWHNPQSCSLFGQSGISEDGFAGRLRQRDDIARHKSHESHWVSTRPCIIRQH